MKRFSIVLTETDDNKGKEERMLNNVEQNN